MGKRLAWNCFAVLVPNRGILCKPNGELMIYGLKAEADAQIPKGSTYFTVALVEIREQPAKLSRTGRTLRRQRLSSEETK